MSEYKSDINNIDPIQLSAVTYEIDLTSLEIKIIIGIILTFHLTRAKYKI